MSATLITGAASGMGQSVALLCANRGDALVLLDSNEGALAATREAVLAAGARAVHVETVDVSRREQIFDAVARATRSVGPPTAAILCAGIHEVKAYDQITEAALRQMLAVNMDGVLWTCQAVLPAMTAAERGAIVVVSSLSGVRGHPATPRGAGGSAHYAASKGAVNALIRSLAREVGGHGVRVNGVAPGMIATPMNANSYQEKDVHDYLATVPMQRVGRPEEVAKVLLFLASEDASYVTGQVLNVCGGSLTA